MSELENIKSLEKYDAWKKAKRNRKNGINLIAGCVGILIGSLLTWAILKVGVGDLWTLGKSTFADVDKIIEYEAEVKKIDEKLKKSIVASPLNWVSKKLEEQAAEAIAKGKLGEVIGIVRIYSLILIFAWLIVWTIIHLIFYYLSYWIIGKYWWPEPLLSSQQIDL